MKKSPVSIGMITSIMCASSPSLATDWTQNWYDNAVVTRPSSYHSQQRGFYTLGGVQSRIDVRDEQLMAISPHYSTSGCVSLDALSGLIRLLDAKYIVHQLDNIMQTAH